MSNLVKFHAFPSTKPVFAGLIDELFNRNLTDFIGTDFAAAHVAVNVVETPDVFKVELAAPGFEKDQIEIKIEDNYLTISGKVSEQEATKDSRFLRREFRQSAFTRKFNLPESVNQNDISAVHTNGILQVSLAKKADAKPLAKQITIS